LYAKANSGEIKTLIGINSEYHPPEDPDFIVETNTQTPDQSIDAIFEYLGNAGFIKFTG
jgi:adenylylsulfate kinase-like enzyme